jgi:DNA-binding response OmpR family regulator
MIKLLLVEDDDILGFMIKDGLDMIGDYEVLWCNNPKAALEAFDKFQPDILVSDVEMPGMTGLELIRMIRAKNPDIPVILETGVSSGKTIVEAYSLGIDNYIKKPYLPAELHAYIQALFRRIGGNASSGATPPQQAPTKVVETPPVDPNEIELGMYQFDPRKQTLESPNSSLDLSVTESLLLEMLAKNKGNLVTKEMIAEHVWGGSQFMNNQSLDVFLHNLRKYLSNDSKIVIKTVRGVGYILEVAA